MASCSGSAVWRWLVFQSTTSQPPSGSAYTASMRPRTTWPASTRANGGSTALGTRSANGPDSKRGDQLPQLVLVVDAEVAPAGQVVGVEERLLAEARLDPGVEPGAEPRSR